MHVVSLCATDCSIAIPAPPPLRAASCSCSFSSLFCICCSCLFRSFIYIIEQWASTTCNINATFYKAGVLLLSSFYYICPAERGEGGSWNPSPLLLFYMSHLPCFVIFSRPLWQPPVCRPQFSLVPPPWSETPPTHCDSSTDHSLDSKGDHVYVHVQYVCMHTCACTCTCESV